MKRERHALAKVQRRRAFYEQDESVIRSLANWDIRSQTLFVGDSPRQYIIDPLASRIAEGYGDFLFGEDVEIEPAALDGVEAANDHAFLESIVDENHLEAELWTAETRCISEGEVWWHVYVDREVADVPLVEWVSRTSVTPLYRGNRLLAAAFVTCVAETDDTYYRLAEIHGDGIVVNALYIGTVDKLGRRVELTALPLTESLLPEWQTGLPILAGVVKNGFNIRGNLGFSEYDRIESLLLELNEARTIGSENARLTAKKRLFANSSILATDSSGGNAFPVGEDIILTDTGGGPIGGGSDKPPVTAVEYSFDAAPLIAHTQEVERTILSRVGLVPQFIGTDVQGSSDSGTALRLRFLPTVNAARAKSREWESKLPLIMMLAMLVDQMPLEMGGFGREYLTAGLRPSVKLGSVLPTDDAEQVRNTSLAVSSEIMSRETAIAEQHPEWDKAAVLEEIDRIQTDLSGAPVVLPPAVQ